MYANVVFVKSCLYSAVSLPLVREQHFIRLIYYYLHLADSPLHHHFHHQMRTERPHHHLGRRPLHQTLLVCRRTCCRTTSSGLVTANSTENTNWFPIFAKPKYIHQWLLSSYFMTAFISSIDLLVYTEPVFAVNYYISCLIMIWSRMRLRALAEDQIKGGN